MSSWTTVAFFAAALRWYAMKYYDYIYSTDRCTRYATDSSLMTGQSEASACRDASVDQCDEPAQLQATLEQAHQLTAMQQNLCL